MHSCISEDAFYLGLGVYCACLFLSCRFAQRLLYSAELSDAVVVALPIVVVSTFLHINYPVRQHIRTVSDVVYQIRARSSVRYSHSPPYQVSGMRTPLFVILTVLYASYPLRATPLSPQYYYSCPCAFSIQTVLPNSRKRAVW